MNAPQRSRGTAAPPPRRRADARPRRDRRHAAASTRLIPEVDGGLRIEAPATDARPARTLLACTDSLPLNLRWARCQGLSLLVLDVAPGACARDEIEAVATTLAAAAGSVAAPAAASFDLDALRALVRQGGLADAALVARPTALELRLPIEGSVRAVLIGAEGDAWRLHCNVLSGVAADGAAEVLADQALRFNAGIRFARLGMREDRIAAQTCVPRRLPGAAFLLRSARAVAAVAHHAAFALTTLHENPEVREVYARLITNEGA